MKKVKVSSNRSARTASTYVIISKELHPTMLIKGILANNVVA